MIKYLCYYDLLTSIENRNFAPSAVNKINYIAEILEEITDEKIEIVSCSRTMGKKFCASRKQAINDRVSLRLFASFGRRNIITRILDYFYIKIALINYLLGSTNRNDVVIAYHSLAYARILKLMSKVKRFILVLEMEELYSDINGNERLRKKEFEVAESADAFIFPTHLLANKVNRNGRPFVVVHGTYATEPTKVAPCDDGVTHCVYSGTFESKKGGAAAAISAALFLPSDFHIHILGFGNSEETLDIKNLVHSVAAKSKARVSFEGLKTGIEYTNFLQRCQIGLSTQNPNEAFNNTSFPSKILTYMGNGLRVVSARIPVVEESAIGHHVIYYEDQKPESIAAAIQSANMQDEYNSRKLMMELSDKFKAELSGLFQCLMADMKHNRSNQICDNER